MAEQVTAQAHPTTARQRANARRLVHGTLWFAEHWILVFSVLYGLFMVLPFMAPVFMHAGWTTPAQAIYDIFSFLCHQMAQRSFFLFGPQHMYNIAQLPLTLNNNMAGDMLALRAFQGNASLGWKVAWSDRMVYMYGAVWIAGMVYGVMRQRRPIHPLHWFVFGLFLVPMAIDGGTHWISDMMSGLGSGFRYDNQWLATLTGHTLPSWFYYGDAFGSFNSWMRLLTGLLFGIAVVWLVFPYLDQSLRQTAFTLREKLVKAGEPVVRVA